MTDTDPWIKWSAIGQILGAAGTFAAVVTSLYLARRAEKPRLRLRVGSKIIIGPGSQAPYPEVISLTLRNVGTLTAHLTQFGWETGKWPFSKPTWLKKQFAIQTVGGLGIGTDPPFEVPPGQRREMILNQQSFFDGIREKKGSLFFSRSWPILGIMPTSIYAVAHLESGVSIRTRIEVDLAVALCRIEREKLKSL